MQQIQDYLQTQSLRLDADAVAVARAATAAVVTQGRAHIERDVLLHDALPTLLCEKIDSLKQLFMALDSVCSRHNTQSAAFYGRQPESGVLVRLVQYGQPLEKQWPMDDAAAQQSLAARTAQSGWANIAENTEKWLQLGELCGEHNRRAGSQTSLPVCGEDGAVYGVLYVETQAPLSENELADWVGLALGVLPLLRQMLAPESANDVEN